MNATARVVALVVAPLLSACHSAQTRSSGAAPAAGTSILDYHGYTDCLELKNESARVIVCPQSGGRVLEYSWKGSNGLYLDPRDRGLARDHDRGVEVSAGRFDIGPEKVIPNHPTLWSGRWSGEIIGPRTVRVTSAPDEVTGAQLIRVFQLDAQSSHLACRQTIVNVSSKTIEWCYWSRTFGLGNGICVIPLTDNSRFPRSYVMYRNDTHLIDVEPEDPNIRQRDGFLEILGAPRHTKLGMDTYAGWFAYLMRNDLMFVKRFPTYPDRVYNEVAGLTVSIWYPADRRVELEPIGPREQLPPGGRASFQEDWWLLPQKFPPTDTRLDLEALARRVARDAPASEAQPVK